MYAFS
ncbi:hypothetical protein D041_0458A, partial [Vibrio parahaemolyticus EKP-008]|jgi:hypothetical protein